MKGRTQRAEDRHLPRREPRGRAGTERGHKGSRGEGRAQLRHLKGERGETPNQEVPGSRPRALWAACEEGPL